MSAELLAAMIFVAAAGAQPVGVFDASGVLAVDRYIGLEHTLALVMPVVHRRRVLGDEWKCADGDVALFSHGHMLRVLGATWMGLAPVAAQLLALDTAALCRLGYEHDYRVLRVWNQDSRLIMEQSA